MKIHPKIKFASALSLLMSCLPGGLAQAASLSSVQGKVELSRAGGAFQVVMGPTYINPGDVVRAEAGSSAQVVYADGAIAVVAGGATLTVAVDPTAVLARRASNGAPQVAMEAVGEPVTATANDAAPETAPDAAASSAGPSLSTTTLVVVGVVAGGGALVLAKTLSGDSKKRTASP